VATVIGLAALGNIFLKYITMYKINGLITQVSQAELKMFLYTYIYLVCKKFDHQTSNIKHQTTYMFHNKI